MDIIGYILLTCLELKDDPGKLTQLDLHSMMLTSASAPRPSKTAVVPPPNSVRRSGLRASTEQADTPFRSRKMGCGR